LSVADRGVWSPAQPTWEGNIVWWIVVLGVLAAVFIAALVADRRKGLRDSLGGSPDQWKVERQAFGDDSARGAT
jgi:hypothetical protein